LELKKPPADDSKPKTGADDELFRGLVGKDPGPVDASKNPLEEAVKGMRSAQERIQEKDTSQATREIQEDVVANLQKLIDMMKNNQNKPPAPEPGSPPPPQNQQQPQPEDGNPMPKPEVPESQPEAGQESQPQTTQQESENALDSTEEERQARDAKAKLSPRPEMLNDVWGHLPPSFRQKRLSLSSDKYLPKYEDLARRYFEALAEPARDSRMKTP
jgi:hypothetical protein